MDANHFAELEKEINGLNAGGHASSSSEDEIGADEKDKFSVMVQSVDRRKLRRKHRQYHVRSVGRFKRLALPSCALDQAHCRGQ